MTHERAREKLLAMLKAKRRPKSARAKAVPYEFGGHEETYYAIKLPKKRSLLDRLLRR